MGTDFTGEIEAVDVGVRSYKAGDKVLGLGGGFSWAFHAQYFTLKKDKAKKIMIAMPRDINYDEAA